MFQWRLKLRQANQALAAGRVEEARQLLGDDDLRDFLPAKQLAGQVAQQYTDRARQRIAWGESAAGMADLKAAEELGGSTKDADAVRHEYAEAASQQAAARLVAGDPDGATRRVDRALRRGVACDELRTLAEIAEQWTESRSLAKRGEMAAAQEQLEGAARLAKAFDAEHGATHGVVAELVRATLGGGQQDTMRVAAPIQEEAEALAARANDHAAARERLHTASATKAWDEALSAAEESLRLAPADPIALGLRRRLWKEIGLGLTKTRPGRARKVPLAMQDNEPARRGRELGQSLRAESFKAQAAGKSTRRSKKKTEDTNVGGATADRRMLWVDAVGGFLVCLDDEIVLGQPAGPATGGTAVPILADISRRHAGLRREGGSYVLQPVGPVKLDGLPIVGPTVLADNHTIQLGEAVRLRFTRPHALSATARLVIESGHRTAPSADAVLLMADSCILGPAAHSHVRCPDWKDDVIVFRKHTGGEAPDELLVRSQAALTADGEPIDGPAPISAGLRVEGEDFSLSVEEV